MIARRKSSRKTTQMTNPDCEDCYKKVFMYVNHEVYEMLDFRGMPCIDTPGYNTDECIHQDIYNVRTIHMDYANK